MDPNSHLPQNVRSRGRLLLQAIFLLLGIGVLVPWNAFISAKSYFYSRLCGESIDSNIESVFAIVFNLSSVLTLGLVILVQWVRDRQLSTEEAPGMERSEEDNSLNAGSVDALSTSSASPGGHSFLMVTLPLAITLVVFVGQTCMVLILHISPPIFMLLTLISLTLCGMCSAVANAGIVASAGLFDADIGMNNFLVGQSLSGVVVSLANFIAASGADPSDYWNSHCEGADDGTETFYVASEASVSIDMVRGDETCSPYRRVDWAVMLYFLLGSGTLFCCLIGYAYIHHFHSDYETVEDVATATATADMDQSPRIGLEMNDTRRRTPNAEEESADERLMRLNSSTPLTEGNEFGVTTTMPVDGHHHDPENETEAVWSRVKGPAVCIFLTFFVTLSLFPQWTSEIRSVRECQTRSRLSNDLYTPFGFLLFNVGDLVGRLLSAKLPLKRVHRLSKKLVAGSMLRFLFFPLLFLCVGGSETNRIQIPSDVYSTCVQFLFAVSNGLLVSTAFAHAPTLLPSISHVQEHMSEILTFSLFLGLLSGSFFSYPVSKLAD